MLSQVRWLRVVIAAPRRLGLFDQRLHLADRHLDLIAVRDPFGMVGGAADDPDRGGAIAAVALVAAGVAIAVGHPQEVSEPILGNEWQCSRTVLLVTTCVPVGEQNGSLPNDAALADLTDGRAPSAIAVARPPRGQMDRSQ